MAKKKSFEQSLEELEAIVKMLEQGDVSLEESLVSFEEGVSLYKFCQDELHKANKKVDELSKSLNAPGINEE